MFWGAQPELEPFPTNEGSLCFPEGPFQTTLITESMAQPALQYLRDPAVSGFTMAWLYIEPSLILGSETTGQWPSR